MAQYPLNQLVSASNATYITNTSGSITAANVRTLNETWISSSALLSGSNTFTGDQSIIGAITASGGGIIQNGLSVRAGALSVTHSAASTISGGLNVPNGATKVETFTASVALFTGATKFSGPVTINSPVTISSSAAYDLAITGTIKVSNVDGNTFIAGTNWTQTDNTNEVSNNLNSYGFSTIFGTGDNANSELGFTNNGANYGISGWDGPSIYINDSSDLYPAILGFQQKSDYTDGRVTALTPLVASSSVLLPTLQTGTTETDIVVWNSTDKTLYKRNNLSLQGAQGAAGQQGSSGGQGPQGAAGSAGQMGASGSQGAQGTIGPSGSQGIQGIQGLPGQSGSSGPQGATGTAGSAGQMGASGSQGPAGTNGNDGSQGAQGYIGQSGSAGIQGPQGSAGSAGQMGASGSQGPQGSTGAGTQGSQGTQGYIGQSGSAGPQGPAGTNGTSIQGVQGYTGANGSQGTTGTQGPIGYAGQSGSAGPQGAQGGVGATGQATQGAQGSTGATGTGTQGPAGTNGTSFIWMGSWGALTNYVTNNVVNYLNSSYIALTSTTGDNPASSPTKWQLMAAQGAVGSTGAQGTQGAIGQSVTGAQGSQGYTGGTGQQGTQGAAGSNGSQGAAGSNGTQGPAGTNGTQGAAGTNGNNGLQGATGAQGPIGQGTSGPQGAQGSAGISLNNAANTRVLVSQGGTGVTCATNMTFDGSTLAVTGAITATGNITAYYSSDKRQKDNITPIKDALAKVKMLSGVNWDWNEETTDEVTKQLPKTGLIAQEVKEVLPEVVIERQDGYLAIDYSKMMGLIVEAIKELDSKIN